MTTPLTAEIFARAIIASAVSYGDHPLAFHKARKGSIHRRCLAPATFAIAEAAGVPRLRICRILGVSSEGSRSAKSHGGERFAKAQAAAAEAIAYHLKAKAERAAALAELAELDADEIAAAPSAEPAAVLSIPCGTDVVEIDPTPPPPTPSRPAPKAAAKPAQPQPRRQERAMPKGRRFVNLGDGITRIEIKPIPERVARMAKQQLDLGADLAFVADCFDLDPEALRAAINILSQEEAA